MDFRWEIIDKYHMVLIGYSDITIAKLGWNEPYEIWELSSDWLECSDDIDDSIGIDDVKEAQLDALERLKESIEESISWYNGQKDMMDELYQDMKR